MFNSSPRTVTPVNPEDKDISEDFIVHNMPDANRFSGQTFSNSQPIKKLPSITNDQKLSSHHKVGILIISGGLILIIILIYLAYVFMIKPVASVPDTNNVATETITKEPVKEEPVTVSPPVTIVATVTPEVIATPTPIIATSTTDLLPEEKSTTPVFNIVSTIDTDLDGLTDDEEKIIGTDPNAADTDSDTFLDIAELKSAYNPLIVGKKMDSTTPFNRYQIDSKASILFLNSWDQTRSDINKTVIFTDEEKSFIQVTAQDNNEKLLPNTWYEQQYSGMMPGEAISGDSWTGFYSQDNAAAYIFSNDLSKIYTITYSPLIANDLSFPLFRLMVKTFVIK